jgi:uncharacterized protein YkwD
MHRTRWLAIAIILAFGVFASLGVTRAEAQSYDSAEMETVELINAYRRENGLGALSLSSPLSVASERHSEDMGTYGFFSHDTVQSSYYEPGWGHSERIAQEGYDYDTFTAENLAYGQATPQEVFEAWRNSPGHNAAMLGDYTVVGIGLVNVGGVPYWTSVFGAEADPSAQPVGAAPSSGGTTPVEEPTAQADQYDNAQTTDNAAGEQYEEEAEIEPVASAEQYDAPEGDTPESADEAAVAEQYAGGGSTPESADTSGADQYRANAERLRAAADQYGEEARRAKEEIAALRAERSQPPATPATETPAESAGTVSPEPQIAAPTSAEQEIPAPSVEDAGAAGSAGRSEEASEVSSGHSEKPSEAMAAVGMVVLPDTGGPPLGSILGAALVVCVLAGARRFMG